MSHWAELDENNVVIRVTVGDNNDPAGDEGYSWLVNNLGGRWVKTSYSGKIRSKFAGIGYIYEESLDVFVEPKCHEEATLNTETFIWECASTDHGTVN